MEGGDSDTKGRRTKCILNLAYKKSDLRNTMSQPNICKFSNALVDSHEPMNAPKALDEVLGLFHSKASANLPSERLNKARSRNKRRLSVWPIYGSLLNPEGAFKQITEGREVQEASASLHTETSNKKPITFPYWFFTFSTLPINNGFPLTVSNFNILELTVTNPKLVDTNIFINSLVLLTPILRQANETINMIVETGSIWNTTF